MGIDNRCPNYDYETKFEVRKSPIRNSMVHIFLSGKGIFSKRFGNWNENRIS